MPVDRSLLKNFDLAGRERDAALRVAFNALTERDTLAKHSRNAGDALKIAIDEAISDLSHAMTTLCKKQTALASAQRAYVKATMQAAGEDYLNVVKLERKTP